MLIISNFKKYRIKIYQSYFLYIYNTQLFIIFSYLSSNEKKKLCLINILILRLIMILFLR